MLSFAVRRLLWIIPVLLVASIITFVVMHVAPGDPYVALLRETGRAPNIIALDDAEPASIAILQALRRDEVVALKLDRIVDEHVVRVNLLGEPVLVPTGPLLNNQTGICRSCCWFVSIKDRASFIHLPM